MTVDLVVKVGGSLLAHPAALDDVLAAIAGAAARARLIVVPGGGPFADAVRSADARLRLPASASHWMAVLAMDQYAHLLAARLDRGVVVPGLPAMASAFASGQVPVLAPFQWMRDANPLPHSWDVTSDSVAAWVAGALGAPRLVLIKAPEAQGDLVDPWFDRTVAAGTCVTVVRAGMTLAVEAALDGPA